MPPTRVPRATSPGLSQHPRIVAKLRRSFAATGRGWLSNGAEAETAERHIAGASSAGRLQRDANRRRWFYVPATTVALACAIHVTDARADLVRGVRMLALTLLAWLLPLMTAFAIAFLLALPVTGLEPLWRTRYATGTLLAAVAALVLLINAAYQDGEGLGSIPNAHCSAVLDGLDAGQLQAVEPRLKDIEINGVRLRVASERGCPPLGERR